MKIVPYERTKLPGRCMYQQTKNLGILEEFINSGLDCAEVKGFTHKTPSSCQNSLRSSIERFGMQSKCRAMVREGRVFLIRL